MNKSKKVKCSGTVYKINNKTFCIGEKKGSKKLKRKTSKLTHGGHFQPQSEVVQPKPSIDNLTEYTEVFQWKDELPKDCEESKKILFKIGDKFYFHTNAIFINKRFGIFINDDKPKQTLTDIEINGEMVKFYLKVSVYLINGTYYYVGEPQNSQPSQTAQPPQTVQPPQPAEKSIDKIVKDCLTENKLVEITRSKTTIEMFPVCINAEKNILIVKPEDTILINSQELFKSCTVLQVGEKYYECKNANNVEIILDNKYKILNTTSQYDTKDRFSIEINKTKYYVYKNIKVYTINDAYYFDLPYTMKLYY